MLITLHNLAYHGWTPRERVAQLGLRVGDGIVQDDGAGIDLLRVGIERSELVNTVSPGFAAEALTPEFGMGLDGTLRAKGDRFVGILNGLEPTSGIRRRTATSPRHTRGPTWPERPTVARTCSPASASTPAMPGRSSA